MLSKISHRAIDQLVDENFIYAKVLHFFGIDFYNNPGKTLNDVCQEYGVDPVKFVSVLENSDAQQSNAELNLKSYPSVLIIEYLKHSHQIFIKDKLPYLSKLINDLDDTLDSEPLVRDLKFIFPLFVEDFIKHIYEEEDRLFSYVNILEECSNGRKALSHAYPQLNQFSIQEFALHHGDSDDEMSGIRGITNDYNTHQISQLHLKVIFKELETFDQDLYKHATIENEILFPRALFLEKKVRTMVQSNIINN